jgi:hypothetical protein
MSGIAGNFIKLTFPSGTVYSFPMKEDSFNNINLPSVGMGATMGMDASGNQIQIAFPMAGQKEAGATLEVIGGSVLAGLLEAQNTKRELLKLEYFNHALNEPKSMLVRLKILPIFKPDHTCSVELVADTGALV